MAHGVDIILLARSLPRKFRVCFPSVNKAIIKTANTHGILDVGFHGNAFSMATLSEGESHVV